MTAPKHTPTPLAWDLFCRVIDNFGDIGVCWRLAAQLGALGHSVRLWTDDASALAWMAPRGAPGVEVLPWPAGPVAASPCDVLVEAFGCDVPDGFLAGLPPPGTDGQAKHPIWINLEYLSAEGYVERSHCLPSPLFSGPGAGRTRWFFYPGFTERTGGLLREPDLPARQAAFDRAGWRARHGIAPEAFAVSLFCYEPAGLPALLDRLGERGDAHLLATPGRATAAVHSVLQAGAAAGGMAQGTAGTAIAPPSATPQGSGTTASASHPVEDPGFPITYLVPCPQTAFDDMLLACDLNAVRGEDSLARALWAGQPFVWHIYPQDDGAHHAKLDAFLDWLQAPASLRRFHHAWNGIDGTGAAVPPLHPSTLADWRGCVQAARSRLLAQDDLVTQLLGFVREKS